jgi:hypothetical protein
MRVLVTHYYKSQPSTPSHVSLDNTNYPIREPLRTWNEAVRVRVPVCFYRPEVVNYAMLGGQG